MISILVLAASASFAAPAGDAPPVLERLTTKVPFPRGLVMVDGKLYVLCRGRVREKGGVTAAIDDQAGTIYEIDPDVSEPFDPVTVGPAVRNNGRVYARPTEPPFRLWDRTAVPPESDRVTDRPYCTLRYDPATDNFYMCAFSGIDKLRTEEDFIAFSKNLSDAVLRYDRRTRRWHEVERHDIEAGGNYPHHDPAWSPPPHGWLNGPDNCLPLGSWLFAVSKDNSLLVRYDLSSVRETADAGPPPSEVVLTQNVDVKRLGPREYLGFSALAFHDGWLYVACRTSSVIFRMQLNETFSPVTPGEVELIARFDPWNPRTGHSANLTDMTFDEAGRLYVISAQPARVFRFMPDPERIVDARHDRAPAWLDLAALTNNPRMKSENILYDDGWLYVTAGDGYAYQAGAEGVVYRVGTEAREYEGTN